MEEMVIQRAEWPRVMLVPMERSERYRKKRQKRFQTLDRIKTKARRVPAKQLDEIIDEAVQATRTRR